MCWSEIFQSMNDWLLHMSRMGWTTNRQTNNHELVESCHTFMSLNLWCLCQHFDCWILADSENKVKEVDEGAALQKTKQTNLVTAACLDVKATTWNLHFYIHFKRNTLVIMFLTEQMAFWKDWHAWGFKIHWKRQTMLEEHCNNVSFPCWRIYVWTIWE